MPRLGGPGAHPRTRARAIQVDRAARSLRMPSAVRGEVLLMRAPAEFGGLSAFADEAVHGPGVDELVGLLRHIRDLGIALGDVNDLDPESLCQFGPGLAAGRSSR